MKRIILALITIALVASVPFTMEAKKKTTRKKAKTDRDLPRWNAKWWANTCSHCSGFRGRALAQ